MASKKADYSSIQPDRKNANKGTERGRYLVEASLRETGAGRSILLDKDGRIIAGNKTFEAASDIGLPVRIVQTDGSELVAVQRTDLDLDDDTGTARKLAYYDNRAAQVGLDWDAEQMLADLGAGLDLSAMFKQDELDELLADLQPKATEGDTPAEVDRAEELRAKWNVQPGQLWALDSHRLICGDCTDAATVARVMGGERAQLMLTDPPYMGALGGNPFPTDAGLKARTEKLKASIDHLYDFDPSEFLKSHLREFCASKAAFMFWCNKVQLPIYMRYAVDNDFRWYLLTWHKPNFIPMNNGKYYPDTEYLFKLSDTGATFNTGIPKEQASYNTYWIEEMGSGGGGHPTEKPLRPHLDQIQICTNAGDIVADPFSGSGTTIIACENLGRKCRACEISPAYVAVALERWSVRTSRQPVLVDI